MTGLLRRVPFDEVGRSRPSGDPEVHETATRIVEDVRARGETALREHAERLGDIAPGAELLWDRERLEKVASDLDTPTLDMLRRAHRRIESFASAQRRGLVDLTTAIPGGEAGHRWTPVESVGAYAPGGRYPLPSSALMTITPARVAGVGSTWLASPRPGPLVAAAALIAGVDGLLAVGGAQAIAAMAFGTLTPPVAMVVGPGNKWVTAAKRHLFGEIGIDGLAGPSEIMVVADDSAEAALAAADLLAQAEHDSDAVPVLVTTEQATLDAVEAALDRQLADLPTADVARMAMKNGFAVLVEDLAQAGALVDRVAPEHLALHVADAWEMAGTVSSYGSLFVGPRSAEAFADYGAGPNHVLPTSGGARYGSGLSVLTFLRAHTWMRIDDPSLLREDTARLARLEGLEAHARAALARS